ncbi:MAG: hypothetical protein HKN04_02060 [Rhodothermaceae bacterium]|nr:hypothetical protein [Rhodothermaceae bacterium]
MRRFALFAVLLLPGCGLAYELHLPDIFDRPAHVTRGELLQRELYAGDCTYVFGEKMLGSNEPCFRSLTRESRTVLVVESLEFFGTASARLFLNSWDELRAFEVTPDVLGQFDGIWEYYADDLNVEPEYAEWTEWNEEDADYEPCEFVDQYGTTRLVTEATRRATWEDDRTRLDLIEHACHGLTRLRFTDLAARPCGAVVCDASAPVGQCTFQPRNAAASCPPVSLSRSS